LRPATVALQGLWAAVHPHHPARRGKPAAVEAAAVEPYCTGLSPSAIGKRLGVSAQSVMRWIKDHARRHCPKPEPAGRAAVVEIDEVWHFVEKRPTSSGSGRRSSARPAA
jgi:transposase